ncbi:fumarylacetoacetate hydrolase family protein [Parapedobacter tibetensis]|uniref:fumarylacetoacetate hydrolase family protein n=1 Tax=Parapedobacter tibetensis TaxID=2972951 RepID=UPI00214DED39|nr:fumarylacetoacetate hydrolase family protein [Parapedobacter tibetensis]
MKLFSYRHDQITKLGIAIGDLMYDLHTANPQLPDTMSEFLLAGENAMAIAKETNLALKTGAIAPQPLTHIDLLAPVPEPSSFRDAYAFRQHVETSRRNRAVPMIPEFDQFPVFYFTNHQAVFGPGDVYCMPEHFRQLDFELEVAIVLNKKGRNIKAKDADTYIAGYMVMNDLSARQLQLEEMKLNLGPAKGKDFATVLGPYLVTPDELEPHKVPPSYGHVGNAYNLEMTCRVNGVQVSKGNFADMHWTFAEIIERVSYGVDVYPGDVIGSGTVGTGCFLELNGTGMRRDPNYQAQWLEPGDTVEMEVTGLGVLSNTVKMANDD